jgi:inner membrane transporter RhtA
MTSARSGTSMAVVAMFSVQAAVAGSVGLTRDLGATTTAWLRLATAAAALLILVRPRVHRFARADLAAAALLGVVTGATTVLFLLSVVRLPLGTASAVEFLGPLGVAVARGSRRSLLWPGLALGGVLLLTQPWRGGADPLGLACALGAAACWAAYILLTQRVGDGLEGLQGLAVSMPVAALAAMVVVPPAAYGHLTARQLLVGAALGLITVFAFGLEMAALRRLTTAAFGTLMALEPGAALLVGAVALGQIPTGTGLAGIALVVAAGIGATRTGGRAPVTAGSGIPSPALSASGAGA